MRPSFTERLARASAARPRRVLALWGAALVLSIVVIATMLPSALTSSSTFTRDIESKRADDLLAERLPAEQATIETLVVRSEARTSDDPAFQAAVADLSGQVAALGPEVVAGPPEPVATSTDGHAVALRLAMAGDAADADEHIADVVKLAEAANGQDGMEVYVTGRASVGHDFGSRPRRTCRRASSIGMPIALIILVIVFGAVVAALLPIVPGDLLDRRGARLDGGRRPGLRALVLRHEHDHDDGPGRRHRLLAVHRLALPRGARARASTSSTPSTIAGVDRQPRGAVQRPDRRLALLGMLIVPQTDLPQPRRRRDPRRARRRGRRR